MQSTKEAKILRFPIEKRLNKEVARKKIGRLMDFRYPDSALMTEDILEWVDDFLVHKKVLLGWSPINRGLVDAFKQGNVCHIVSNASVVDVNRKPLVEVCCKGHETLYLHNWKSNHEEMYPPASLLSMDQANYFRVCTNCAAYMRDNGGVLKRR
jgi:hypothetical protein